VKKAASAAMPSAPAKSIKLLFFIAFCGNRSENDRDGPISLPVGDICAFF
jgi:hypothetical protein